MYSFLLVIIYMAFISLGLPDSLVGSAWPVMHTELNVPVSYAGMITMVIAAGRDAQPSFLQQPDAPYPRSTGQRYL